MSFCASGSTDATRIPKQSTAALFNSRRKSNVYSTICTTDPEFFKFESLRAVCFTKLETVKVADMWSRHCRKSVPMTNMTGDGVFFNADL